MRVLCVMLACCARVLCVRACYACYVRAACVLRAFFKKGAYKGLLERLKQGGGPQTTNTRMRRGLLTPPPLQ